MGTYSSPSDFFTKDKLAIEGGVPVRTTPMPARMAVGKAEQTMITEALNYYNQQQLDPGYQGPFEERYCDAFCKMMGGGYADAVATGTSAVYIALAALNLPEGSEVLVSPITDPGTISAIILNRLKPKLVDSKVGSYNTGINEIKNRITERTSCILVVHSIGQAAEIDSIVKMSLDLNLKVLEDCSQAHGAFHKGKRVGTFGDIAAFSTMYRKTSITGASGGMVFSNDIDIYHQALAHADRGKPRWLKDFDDRNPAQYLFPALNLNTDEISCAIGLASINRLDDTRRRRLEFVSRVADLISSHCRVCEPFPYSMDDSPFIYPIIVNTDAINVDKRTFANAILAEGIGLNPHYNYLVKDWPWLASYLNDDFDTSNARIIRDKTFNLYLNENYTEKEAIDTVKAILKVENAFLL